MQVSLPDWLAAALLVLWFHVARWLVRALVVGVLVGAARLRGRAALRRWKEG